MKKRWIVISFLSVCLCMLAACGKQESADRRTEDAGTSDAAQNTESDEAILGTEENITAEGVTENAAEDNVENIQDVTDTETNSETEESFLEEAVVNEEAQEEKTKMLIEVNGQQFEAKLYGNDTAAALAGMLPMTLNMEEMNGNEKYYFMDDSLPAAAENIGTIQNGDIMLYGSDCLVLFFKTFDTAYTYTRIGHIEDADGFAAALDRGTVEVKFSMIQE